MSSYFKYFPLVNYRNTGIAKNITARAIINMRDKAVIKQSLVKPLRPDQIADRFYNDQNLDWAVYIANDVLDPYYDVYLNDDVLHSIIINNYGSLEEASQKIVFWESNWRGDIEPIAVSVYNSLPADAKGFFNAKTDGRGNVVSYVRKRRSIYKATNIIVRYELASELDVEVGSNVTLGTFEGRGTVVSVDGNYLTVQHILNSYNVATVEDVVVNDITFIEKSISDTEAPYFSPVTAYDAAVTANELRRKINLVPSNQAENLRKELKRALA
jgi:hypothetical protein